MLSHELRFVLRGLRRSPGFLVASVLTIACGVAGTMAVFSAADSVLLRPLPFPDAEGLVAVEFAARTSISGRTFDRLARESPLYQTLAAYSRWGFTLLDAGDPVKIPGARVTPSLFTTLRVAPAIGRIFTDAEVRAGDDGMAVLSDGLWRTRFGADKTIIGRTIQLNGRGVRVVGVMPPGFAFPHRSTAIWTPAPLDPSRADDYAQPVLTVFGRLAANASAEAATAELRAFRTRLRQESDARGSFDPFETRVRPLADQFVANRAPTIKLLAVVALFVLLIACANVANLFLLRATSKGREIAVRAALGASRNMLARTALIESLVVAAAGTIVGCAFAVGVKTVALRVIATDAALLRPASVNIQWLFIAVAGMLGVALLTGLAPAAQASKSSLASLIRAGVGTRTRGRLRTALVASELAFALSLAVGAGLLVKSLMKLQGIDSGFHASARVTAVRVSQPDQSSAPEQVAAFWDDAERGLASIPGVTTVGAIHLTPMGPDNWNPGVTVLGAAPPATTESQSVDWRAVTPGYFGAVGIPVRAGRLFTSSDRAGTPLVAVVNEAFVRKYLGANPLGQQVRTAFENQQWATVIGVVADVRGHGLANEPEPELYRPSAQHPLTSMTIMVQSDSRAGAPASAIRQRLAAIDRRAVIESPQSFDAIIDASVGDRSSMTRLVLLFGALALTIAAIGVYGVVSFIVSQQTREIGVRIAIGASPFRIAKLVLRVISVPIGGGILLGLAMAVMAGGLMQAQLYEVDSRDGLVMIAAAAVLCGVALVAAIAPTRRALRIDPTIALRAE